MSADPQLPSSLKVGSNLSYLLQACEATCVADCCGLDAFDFSPLYAAAHLSRYSGEISAKVMDEISEQLRDLLNQAAGLAPTPEGWICVIDQLNQCFTHDDLVRFTERVERCVRLAPQVLKYARELDASAP